MALPPAAPRIAACSPTHCRLQPLMHCRKQLLALLPSAPQALPPSALSIAACSPSHCRKQPHTARNYDSGIISRRIYDSKADTMWTTALTQNHGESRPVHPVSAFCISLLSGKPVVSHPEFCRAEVFVISSWHNSISLSDHGLYPIFSELSMHDVEKHCV